MTYVVIVISITSHQGWVDCIYIDICVFVLYKYNLIISRMITDQNLYLQFSHEILTSVYSMFVFGDVWITFSQRLIFSEVPGASEKVSEIIKDLLSCVMLKAWCNLVMMMPFLLSLITILIWNRIQMWMFYLYVRCVNSEMLMRILWSHGTPTTSRLNLL